MSYLTKGYFKESKGLIKLTYFYYLKYIPSFLGFTSPTMNILENLIRKKLLEGFIIENASYSF